MEAYKYMVFTKCLTYNHAPYIIDAMNGFCMQKTSFPFLITILEDASTDGEPEIINKYLQENFNLKDEKMSRCEETEDYRLVYAQHKTNKNCFFVVFLLKYNHHTLKKNKTHYYANWVSSSKYMAYCEGDDYWTDPNKLQRQVNFLESHPDYSAIAENGLVKNSIYNKEYPFNNANSHDVTMEEVIITRRFPTAGVMGRKDAMDGFMKTCRLHVDTIQWCWLISKGKFRYDNIISSVYRKGQQGMTVYTEPYVFAKTIEHWNMEILRVLKIRKSFMYLHIAKIYKSFISRSIKRHHYISAIKCFAQGIAFTNKAIIYKLFFRE